MAKKKNFVRVFPIFFSSIKTYFQYSEECLKALLFPVFGQIIALFFIFGIAYYVRTNESSLTASPFVANHFFELFLAVIIPFLILFVKAVYDYIIAFSAFNILFYTVSGKKKKKNVNFKEYRNVIQRKIFKYSILLILVSLLLAVPPFIIVAPITAIFLSLTFQIFALEPETSPVGAIARSLELVKDNLLSTLIMIFLCTGLTYFFFPAVFIRLSDITGFTSVLIGMFDGVVNLLPLVQINDVLSIVNINVTSVSISQSLAENLIVFFVAAFSLPFRCCCFTELYKLYDSDKIKEYSKETEEIIRRSKKRKN